MDIITPVELLKRQFLQLVDPEELTLPCKELLRLPDTQAQIYSDLFDASRIFYVPPERYQFRVLKKLVKALEDAIEDPEEDVGLYPSRVISIMALHCCLRLSHLGRLHYDFSTNLLFLAGCRRSQMIYWRV